MSLLDKIKVVGSILHKLVLEQEYRYKYKAISVRAQTTLWRRCIFWELAKWCWVILS